MYENRNYIILPVSELPKVDFGQVLETSEETVRRSVDGTKTFVKWEGDQPSFVDTPRFYYTVWGERKDVPKLEVEV